VPADSLHPDVAVATSSIAGHGLHAKVAISRGATVLRFAVAPRSAAALGTLNHSCDPNLVWADDTSLVTLRDVAAGEELTVDYATAIDDPDFALFCHCETYRCRQVIEGTDWRIPQLQQRYAGHWHPVIQRLIDSGG
jgi:hypothetical protein